MKATKVRDFEGRHDGHKVALYLCEPGGPLPPLVIVSTINEPLPFGEMSLCETYIFAADETGQVTSWTELAGSAKGVLDHKEALRGAGYEVRP